MLEQHWETSERVVSAGREIDPTFGPVVFRKWRDLGLMPRPVETRGMGRGKGREVFYPAGTSAHLQAVLVRRNCEKPRRFEPNLELWRLWWNQPPESGFITGDCVRESLSRWVEALNSSIQATNSNSDHLTDKQVTQQTKQIGNQLPKSVAQWFRRLSVSDRRELLMLQKSIAQGSFRSFSEYSASAKIGQSRIVTLARLLFDMMQLQSTSQLESAFRSVAHSIGPSTMVSTIRAQSEYELEQAKSELQRLFAVLSLVATTPQLDSEEGRFLFSGWICLRQLEQVRAGTPIVFRLLDSLNATLQETEKT